MKKRSLACLLISLTICIAGCQNSKKEEIVTEDTKPIETETTAVETVGKDIEVTSAKETTTKEEKTTKKEDTTKKQETSKKEETTKKQETTKNQSQTTNNTSKRKETKAPPSNKPSGATTVEINASVNAVNEASKVIKSIINNNMSEYERVKAIHDWIVINVQYDYAGLINNTLSETAYKADGALIYKLAVCQGYAEAFQLLCAKAGIQSYMMYGESGNDVDGWDSHAWNVVRINGEWYQIDCTWDDPLINGVVVTGTENLSYTYFLLTDDEMYYDHKLDKEYTENEKVCTSTLFYGYSKYLTLDAKAGNNENTARVATAVQLKEAAKKYAKQGVNVFLIEAPDSITNAKELIQEGIRDGLVEKGVEGNFGISYTYEQVFDYILYEVTITTD